jgi:hypothetical protein
MGRKEKQAKLWIIFCLVQKVAACKGQFGGTSRYTLVVVSRCCSLLHLDRLCSKSLLVRFLNEIKLLRPRSAYQ